MKLILVLIFWKLVAGAWLYRYFRRNPKWWSSCCDGFRGRFDDSGRYWYGGPGWHWGYNTADILVTLWEVMLVLVPGLILILSFVWALT